MLDQLMEIMDIIPSDLVMTIIDRYVCIHLWTHVINVLIIATHAIQVHTVLYAIKAFTCHFNF